MAAAAEDVITLDSDGEIVDGGLSDSQLAFQLMQQELLLSGGAPDGLIAGKGGGKGKGKATFQGGNDSPNTRARREQEERDAEFVRRMLQAEQADHDMAVAMTFQEREQADHDMAVAAALHAEEAPDDPDYRLADARETGRSWRVAHLGQEPEPTVFARAAARQQQVGESYEELLRLDDGIRHPGLDATDLQFATAVQELDAPGARRLSEAGECAICLGAYETGQRVRRLPCLCTFHRDCVDRYFRDHTTCPICRVDVKRAA